MRGATTIKAFAIGAVFCSSLFFYYWTFILNPLDAESRKLLTKVSQRYFNRSSEFYSSFIQYCHSYNIELYLIDPPLLQDYLQEHTYKTKLLNMFSSYEVVSFAILQKDVPIMSSEKFHHNLAERHFEVNAISGQDSHGEISANHFLVRHTLASFETVPWIHIAVLHHRHESYFWLGPFRSSIKEFPQLNRIPLPSAFKRFSGTKSLIDGMSLPKDTVDFLSSVQTSRYIDCGRYAKIHGHPQNAASSLFATILDKLDLIFTSHKVKGKYWISEQLLTEWKDTCTSSLDESLVMTFGMWNNDMMNSSLSKISRGNHVTPIEVKYRDNFGSVFSVSGMGRNVSIHTFQAVKDATSTLDPKNGIRLHYNDSLTVCSTELSGRLIHLPCNVEMYVPLR